MRVKYSGRRYLAALVVVLAVLAGGCRETTNVGSEVLGELDRLNPLFTDTLTLITRTLPDDSLRTDALTVNHFGSIIDPVFGKTFAQLYAQVRIPTNNIDLGDDLVLDSVVLQLRYTGIYGDPTAAHTIRVFQLSDSMDAEENYYSYQGFATYPIGLARMENFVPNPGDSSFLRIPLNNSFGNWILQQSGDSAFASNTNFLRFFKGLLITTDTLQGYSKSLIKVDLLNPLSHLVLYFKAGDIDSLSLILPINTSSASQNQYIHQFTNPDISRQIDGTVLFDSINHVSGLAGLLTKVDIPYLSNLGDISILKAELVVTRVDRAEDSVFTSPRFILPRLQQSDSSGTNFVSIFDESYALSQSLYDLGGSAKVEQNNGVDYTRYRINLLRHLQFVADGSLENEPIFLKSVPTLLDGGRMQLGGGNHPNNELRMKLNLYYVPK